MSEYERLKAQRVEIEARQKSSLESRVRELEEGIRALHRQAALYSEKLWSMSAREIEFKLKALLEGK